MNIINHSYFIFFVVFFAAGIFIFIIYRFIRKIKLQANNFKQQGIPCKATIISITNEQYKPGKMGQIKLSLQLTNNAGQLYTTECIAYGTEEERGEFFEGKVVDVLRDPANEKNIALNYKLGGRQSTAMSFYANT